MMRKVLFILGQLSDMDAQWLGKVGIKKTISNGTILINEGVKSPNLYILLQGVLMIEDSKIGPIAELGIGEVVGEMSFVDNAPPSASVIAHGDCIVLQLSHDELEKRIAVDPAFGMRLYKALCFFLADRLRGTIRRFGYGEGGSLDSDEILADELDENLLDTVSIAGERFDRMLKQLAAAKSEECK